MKKIILAFAFAIAFGGCREVVYERAEPAPVIVEEEPPVVVVGVVPDRVYFWGGEYYHYDRGYNRYMIVRGGERMRYEHFYQQQRMHPVPARPPIRQPRR